MSEENKDMYSERRERLLKNKELIYRDGYVFINPDYLYVMNEILIKIL